MHRYFLLLTAGVTLMSCSDSSASGPACDGGGDHPASLSGPTRDSTSVLLVGGDPAQCPDNPVAEALGGTCVYRVECQGGPVDFTFSPGWTASAIAAPAGCSHPFDSCPALGLHCRNGEWNHAGGLDEPAECDWNPPAQGDACLNPSAATSSCGYWCYGAEGGSWTVATCATGTDGTRAGTWQFDRTCPCL